MSKEKNQDDYNANTQNVDETTESKKKDSTSNENYGKLPRSHFHREILIFNFFSLARKQID